jgi:PAS domain S-box-containing protein
MSGISSFSSDNQKNDHIFKSLFDNSFSVMLLIDPVTGGIIDANDAACNYYGWNHAQLCEMNISEINMLSDREVKEELRNAATEKRNHFHFKHRLANGDVRDVEVFSSPDKTDNTRPLFSIIRDITDRKRVEEELEMLNAYLTPRNIT